jgi:hypothetical protein
MGVNYKLPIMSCTSSASFKQKHSWLQADLAKKDSTKSIMIYTNQLGENFTIEINPC